MMPFDRLVQAMDEFAISNPGIPVEIQIGRGKYEPKHASFIRFMPVVDYRERVANARLFIAHAGMGSILSAIEASKPLLMLPRLKNLGEHNTDHQIATAATVGARQGLYVAADAEDLKIRALALVARSSLLPDPISRFADPAFTTRIRTFIEAA